MSKWVTDYVRDASKFLSRIAAYLDKNIELHLQVQRELLPRFCIQSLKLLKVPDVSSLRVTSS